MIEESQKRVSSDDQALALRVRAAVCGDRAAYERLCRDYEPLVRALALARVPPDIAEDIVQDVFETTMRKLPELREASAFRAWLLRIARRRIADHYRREKSPVDLEPAAFATSSSGEQARAVLDVMRSLNPVYAETLALRFVEGMTGPEIAKVTGMTDGSVRVNLCRGMKLLRRALAQRGYHVG